MHADFHDFDLFMLQQRVAARPLAAATTRPIAVSYPSARATGRVLPLEPELACPLPAWRRVLDLVIASSALVALAPLMLLVALAIRLTSPGPVLFVQERTGLGGRRFRMFKFRTMVAGAHEKLEAVKHLNEMSGPLIKINGDPRLTRLGRVLRKTSIDELPQLVNILRGEMTLIGPRALSPLPESYEPWQRRRFCVVPGLACTWQAERRAERDFRAWMRMDLHYIDRATPLTDLKLMARIALKVLLCRGAS